jgi:hypothetical protein
MDGLVFQGLWSLAWRSLAYFPIALVFWTGAGTYVLSLLTLPLISYVEFVGGAWIGGSLSTAAWLFLIVAWRKLQLARCFS